MREMRRGWEVKSNSEQERRLPAAAKPRMDKQTMDGASGEDHAQSMKPPIIYCRSDVECDTIPAMGVCRARCKYCRRAVALPSS